MIFLSLQEADHPALIKRIAKTLSEGGVVALPTDTIYGFSCLADNARAIRRVYSIKGREPDKPLIILVSSLTMAQKYVRISERQKVLLKQFWADGERPTTVILEHRGLLPRALSGDSDGLAVRLPKSNFLIKILKMVGRPLVSTSLNLSGQPDIHDPEQLADHWPDKRKQPDMVAHQGKLRRTRASRIIDLRGDKAVVIRK